MRLELDEVARALTMQLAATDEELAGLALNSLTNDAAMSTLLHGFAGDVERRFLRATDEPLEIKGVRSARIHVLGPPEDKDTLRRMNPPASERWLADTGPDGPSTAPFPPELSMTPDEFRRRYSDLALPAETVKRLRTGIAEPLEAVSWLDRCVNNTSVFMALEVDDIVVLLAGDAQWGPWRRAMADQRICDLIRRVNVYKVSHHGSHNGTPRSLVEGLLRDDVLSLVSVHPVKAWKNIPKDTLVQALSVANRELARSDDSVVPASLHRQTDGLWIEATLPRA
jgi:hypothetical protein